MFNNFKDIYINYIALIEKDGVNFGLFLYSFMFFIIKGWKNLLSLYIYYKTLTLGVIV